MTGDPEERWKRESAERQAAEDEAWRGRPDPWSIPDRDLSQRMYNLKWIEGERQLTRRLWERGELPRTVRHHLPFMYAKAFLYALDSIMKALGVLTRSPLQSKAAEALEELRASVPDIALIRNTAQHYEDRARWLGTAGKPLDMQPIDNQMISAPDGALVLNSLNGAHYGCTVADGRYAEVDVTAATLLAARNAIQKVLDSIVWRQPAHLRRSPSPHRSYIARRLIAMTAVALRHRRGTGDAQHGGTSPIRPGRPAAVQPPGRGERDPREVGPLVVVVQVSCESDARVWAGREPQHHDDEAPSAPSKEVLRRANSSTNCAFERSTSLPANARARTAQSLERRRHRDRCGCYASR